MQAIALRSAFCVLLGIALVTTTVPAAAKPSTQVKTAVSRAENTDGDGETLILPFAFSSESTELVFGAGGMRKGFHQDQMLVGGAAWAGAEAHGGFAGVWDYRFKQSRRLFVSFMGMLGYYPQHRAYALPKNIFLPPDVARPGSNDSNQDFFLESEGYSNWWEVQLDYVFPLGAASERGRSHYALSGGLLTSEPSGGGTWNPLESGVTIATLRQYNRYQSYEFEATKLDGDTHVVEFGLLHDNTDFPINPSRGSRQYIAYHQDPGWFGSVDKWNFIEAETSQFFSLGSDDWATQRIIALNAWTGYSPSWALEQDAQGNERVQNGPPFLEGANLGGFYRMRGFRDSRFHDRAAIYAAAEYRYTLRHNPLQNIRWLDFLELDWIQLVAFAEGGRVAPEYKLGTLFEDWKSDGGFGIRALTAGIVVRFDLAFSEEGTNAWVMVGHPF